MQQGLTRASFRKGTICLIIFKPSLVGKWVNLMTPHATRFQRKCSFEMGITQSISTSIAVTTRQSMLITSPTLISTMSTNSRTWFQAEPSSEHGQDSSEEWQRREINVVSQWHPTRKPTFCILICMLALPPFRRVVNVREVSIYSHYTPNDVKTQTLNKSTLRGLWQNKDNRTILLARRKANDSYDSSFTVNSDIIYFFVCVFIIMSLHHRGKRILWTQHTKSDSKRQTSCWKGESNSAPIKSNKNNKKC